MAQTSFDISGASSLNTDASDPAQSSFDLSGNSSLILSNANDPYQTSFDFSSNPFAQGSNIDISQKSFAIAPWSGVLYDVNDTSVEIKLSGVDFTSDVTSGYASLTVNFIDLSLGTELAWDWDFGDGTAHGTTQNPAHIYTQAGIYTVILTVTFAGGSQTKTATNYITVYATDFSGSPTTGTNPLQVAFSDLTEGNPTSWSWDFGDGGTSTDQNPTHTYSNPGFYDVTLVATKGASSGTRIKDNYIVVTQALSADFYGTPTSGRAPLVVSFTDSSLGSPDSWNWDFGDGNTSTLQNPYHIYLTAGSFDVSLIVAKGTLHSTNTISNYINVQAAVAADFTTDVTSGAVPLSVQFTDTSLGNPTGWLWDFGDGEASIDQDPSHTYETKGIYSVILTVFKGPYSDSVFKYNLITAIFEANFTSDIREGEAPLQVNFTDLSIGHPTRWHWNFGDYSTSDEQNPSHIYYFPGFYTVSLTITRDGSVSVISIRDYIFIYPDDIKLATIDEAPPGTRIKERTLYARGHANYLFLKKGIRIQKTELYRG